MTRRKTRKPRAEARAQTATQSDPRLLEVLGLHNFMHTAAGVNVTVETALGVPAIWAAVNFIAGSVAGLPVQVFRRDSNGRTRIGGPVAALLSGAVNEETSRFDWLKYTLEQALTGGRGLTFVERDGRNRVVNLWPLEPSRMTIKMREGQRRYIYEDPTKGSLTYTPSEIIDLPFMMRADRLNHRSPITTNREVIGLAIAVTQYGARYLQGGGVPPFAVTGNFQSGDAMRRAAQDLDDAVQQAASQERQALVLPPGLEIKPIGADPEKNQMVLLQRFVIEQVARIYMIPPVFLQDLTHGTFSNTEQQDLHFVKHTLKRWVEALEQELTLKLFGRGDRRFIKFNVDGLLRGDFKTRMEGHATAIQNGIETPNEARALENRPPLDGGDQLMIQGATVPLAGMTEESANDV